ncbi:MAG: 3-deoxy-8-phosphooctulonate synthase [Thermodesulfobacteriota bacterium]
MTREVVVRDLTLGGDNPLALIAGPCVIESEQSCLALAKELKNITRELGVPFIFKASYDKANRTSHESYRGPGLRAGLSILARVRAELDLAILSDVHEVAQVGPAAEVLDVLQVPAYLSRQTDLILEVARTGKPVNIKKGQFLSPWELEHVISKAVSVGNYNVLVTERGTCFGYNNLVADMRALPILRAFGQPVFFDATHTLQLPGAGEGASGGERGFIPYLARAAVAAGVDGLFIEVHPDPDRALSDGPNSLALAELSSLLRQVNGIDQLVKGETR